MGFKALPGQVCCNAQNCIVIQDQIYGGVSLVTSTLVLLATFSLLGTELGMSSTSEAESAISSTASVCDCDPRSLIIIVCCEEASVFLSDRLADDAVDA